MEIRNSSLVFVPFIWACKNSIDSWEFISARWLRSIHIRCKASRSSSRSSRRVLEAVISIAGEYPFVGQFTVKLQFHVAGTLKFLKYNLIHF